MSVKKNRRAKVYGASVPGKREGFYGATSYKTVPQIKLIGQWLEEIGFTLGAEMSIECNEGQLIIKESGGVCS